MIRCSGLVVVVGAFLVAGASPGRGSDAVELGVRYIDPVNGFSLRPPAGTERRRQISPSLLVSWVERDAATGAVAWTLSVSKVTEGKAKIDLPAYAKDLAARLRRSEGFDVKSAEVVPVAGKQAIDVRGAVGGKSRLWKRQVWVLAGPAKFLIVQVAGPLGTKPTLNAVCQTVLGTLRIIDPKAAAERRRENLARGEKLLAALTDKQLAAAVDEGRWYLVRIKGAEAGFMYVEGEGVKVPAAGKPAYRIAMCWYFVLGSKKEVHLVRRKMLTTADRSYERWVETVHTGSTKGEPAAAEDGILQNQLIRCTVTSGGKHTPRQQKVPGKLYLPRALGFLLPRVVDLKTPAAYAFGGYTSQTNRFDVRTFTVVGPDRITVGDRQVDAIRATDQTAVDVEPATLWVDPHGRLLRMRTAEGFLMEPATASAVKRRFPKAKSLVEGLAELSVD